MKRQGKTNIDKFLIFRVSIMLLLLIIIGIIIVYQENLSGIIVFLMLFGLIFITILYLAYEHLHMKQKLLNELNFYKVHPKSMPANATKKQFDFFGVKWNVFGWNNMDHDEFEIWVDPIPMCKNHDDDKNSSNLLSWHYNIFGDKLILKCSYCNFKQKFSGSSIEMIIDWVEEYIVY